MSYKFYLLIILMVFHLRVTAQVGIFGVANVNLQNATQSISQLSHFGNTDFRLSPNFGLQINRSGVLHLINVAAHSSNVGIRDRGYFHTQFLSVGYARLIPKKAVETRINYGYGLDISTSFSQTRSSYATLETIEEGGFGEIVKFSPYIQSRISLSTSKSGFSQILDAKIGVDLLGISQGNGLYNPMYFVSIGFGFLKEIKK